MKKLSLWLGLSLTPLILCACSQDWSGGLESARLNRGGETLAGTAMPSAVSSSAIPDTSMAQGRRASAFAGYPDTGSLVHYAAEVAPRRTGAYTWHAAELSEEHAFRAVASGELTFESPDGTPIKLAYQRHVEHPDGNWSWIGEAADGQTAVITFGEEAVFGTIPQGNEQPPLRLTLSDGRAWVVSADKGLLGEIRNEATHPTSPDYLLPPRRVQASGNVMAEAPAGGATASAAPTIEAAAAGTTVIDVLVGYTGGFAAARGSQSAAVTRIRNLVDITNQAYVTSQINAELRLVHSMQVSFADNTDNTDALEKLTGFRAPSTRITPDPAFNALRQARETYGADLVALVRKFNDPENDGCGVAWLLGGGMSGINSSDEYFGYSVISDGQDAGTDGKTYFCREETFAHEIGHNLGSQHDSEAADNEPGAFSYSYGYKTGSTQGNFYTIMAYGDSGQTGYRVFSNPNITTCGGRACGTASANNARSINNTASIIAGFRATKIDPKPARRADLDVNGDGISDLLWLFDGSSTGSFQYWLMNGLQRIGAGSDTTVGRSRLAGSGDFDGDGHLDLVWDLTQQRSIQIWFGRDDGTFNKRNLGGYASNWKVVAAGDVDGDGKSDLLWRSTTEATNNFQYWLMDGLTRLSIGSMTVGQSYVFRASGDFNADGKLDILWDAPSASKLVMTLSTSIGLRHFAVTTYAAGWSLVGVGDVNGDGTDDLLWRYHTDRANNFQFWMMNGAQRLSIGQGTVSRTNRIAATGDYNGDGRVDIVWDAPSVNALGIWMSNGATSYTSMRFAGYSEGWMIQDPGL
ncbi:reprolysin-like metallopeptidase [Marilutibacter chinensis]|uniref:FG-GAP-like repeat-containing protein n=1 Tax=Marilutibacter chinensis TaxID=2912247 RepID=A0ABS9HSX2_9GAMM|nr:FG-GAP-like repeat-containing protein [Lysobacter chinensis]MCF7221299.1 FG-GAP-like repeat-containing protein [Lysobacter chinensis]